MNHKLICLSLLLIGLLSQCTKKPLPPAGKTEFLVKVWKMNQVQINGQQDLSTNYSSWLWEFRSNNQYYFTQNGQLQQGRWEMTANAQQIVLNPNTTAEQVMRILVLTDTALELEADMAADYKTGARTMTYKLIP